MVKLTESTVYIRTKCSVEAVKKLNLWGCDIDDISLCEQMTSLEVLSLSVNRVETLQPLRNCTHLTELYLRKNQLTSLSELDYIKNLSKLRVLWIDDNPCTQIGEYRHKVVKMLPQITKLDDKPVSLDDQADSASEESTPECDLHSARSSRSGTINDIMSRSLYGRAIVDTVMQPQMVHYGDTSDDERVSIRETQRNRQMTQSVYGTLPEDEWGDFNVDDDIRPMSMDSISQRMCASMHESYAERTYPGRSMIPTNGRSISVPRRRIHHRQQSVSPARDQRLSKIMSAVSVLLDELDQEGLRGVVEEAQQRMKKQR